MVGRGLTRASGRGLSRGSQASGGGRFSMIWVDGARISHVINPESWKTARLGAAGTPRGLPYPPYHMGDGQEAKQRVNTRRALSARFGPGSWHGNPDASGAACP